MDALLFHPKLVHVPIALGVLMPLIAATLLLAWWRDWLPRRAWILAVGLQAVLLASGILALRTGEAEEDRVERVVAGRFVAEHEEEAERFVWSAGVVLVVMLLAAGLGSRRAGLPLAALATLGTVVVLVFAHRTGEAGGNLVYRHGAASVYGPPAPTTVAPHAHDD